LRLAAGVALLLGGLSWGCGSSSQATTTIPEGIWGTAAAELDVSSTGATLFLCCASGQINPPLTVFSNGAFNLSGTYQIEEGPIPVGGNQPVPASYTGVINGNQMNLTVSTAAHGSQSYVLTFGTRKTIECVCAL
jgi:hypothetical protein